MNRIEESRQQFSSGKLLYLRVSEKISEYITEHGIGLGDKLPSERELCTILGVSRNSVREALRDLENQGTIRVEAGRGSFLSGEVTDRAMMIRLKKHNFFELFEIKTVLEKHMIRELTPIIAMEVLQQLETIALQMVALSNSEIFPQELDDKFHILLLETHWNKEMCGIVRNMLYSFADYNNEYFNRGIGIVSKSNQSIFDTIPLHLDMIRFMMQRDVEKAVATYRKIIDIDIDIYSLIKG